MVCYGGVTLSQIDPTTPCGVCGADFNSKQSFFHGKIHRMGHYAKILLARFRR
jgi:hypothetical protein